MKFNVLSLIAVCVLTLCCLVTAGMYRLKSAESHRLQRQVNSLRIQNVRLMAEFSEIRARMNRDRAGRTMVSYGIANEAKFELSETPKPFNAP
jgi:hypothetical protein